MKLVFLLLLVSFAFLSKGSFAQKYIVLFHQSEIGVGSLEHGEYQVLLKSANEKNMKQLSEWMDSRRNNGEVNELWIIRGAIAELNEDEAKKLGQEAWVHRVIIDKKINLIKPTRKHGIKTTPNPENLWNLKRLNLEKIRLEFPELNGSNIRVGLLDSGLKADHPEFNSSPSHRGAKILAFKDFISEQSAVYDDEGHGTHVAGIIAGQNTGFAPKVGFIVGKVLNEWGGGTWSGIVSGMQWIFDPDGDPQTDDFPQVINNSWGAYLPSTTVNELSTFEPFDLAAQAWVNGGITAVFSAGNSGVEPCSFPAALQQVLAVGAINELGEVSEFSSMGPNLWRVGNLVTSLFKPDLSAPGEKISSSVLDNQYDSLDGTSMAAPHVTAAIALGLQANDKLSVADVKELLMASSEKKKDRHYGYGILNTYEFIKLAISRRERSLK